MKLSEIIRIQKPSYTYYKLTPNYSIRNQSTYKIARAISSLYRNVFQRIQAEERRVIKLLGKDFLINTKYKLNTFEKIGYFIYMEKKKVEFYFIIPQQHETVLKEKIKDVWNGLTIEEANSLPIIKNSLKRALNYDKEDGLSLQTDRRNNNLLTSNLNVTSVLEESDKLGIYYNFIPTTQHTWKNEHQHTIDKVKINHPVNKEKTGVTYLLKLTLTMITDIVESVLSVFNDKKPLDGILSALNGTQRELSPSTINKGNGPILNTQIILLSESDDTIRRTNNIRALSQSFDTISDDNRLISKPFKGKFSYNQFRYNAPVNKMSDLECGNFISLAGREILEEYNFIDKVVTKETQVPEELQEGIIRIGTNKYRGDEQMAYLSNDKEYRNLTQMLIGPTRAGKSTLIQNMSYDALNNGECVFIFDFIKNCELSNEVAELFPSDKVLKIQCDDFRTLQGLGYNEVGKTIEPFEQYNNAKRQTTQLLTLVNSINSDESNLTPKMERYLTSASLVVFINNGSIKDVFDVLQNHMIRHQFINQIPKQQHENMQEYIQALYTLDECDKEGLIVDTKLNLIVGIIDRLNKLKANTYMELMLKKDTKGNFDLSKEIQKNQLICLQMPEDMFSTDGERDIYTTYWITKLWLALQVRGKQIDRNKHTKLNLIIDELYQVKNTEKFLTDKLSRLAKFTVKPIISCHYINQLKYMRSELRSANASYMLISGVDKKNFDEFKEELYPYELEDLIKLPRYHSLNIIKYSEGYAKFITKLPKPLGG